MKYVLGMFAMQLVLWLAFGMTYRGFNAVCATTAMFAGGYFVGRAEGREHPRRVIKLTP